MKANPRSVTLLPKLRSSHLEHKIAPNSLTLYWGARVDLDPELLRSSTRVRPLRLSELLDLMRRPPAVVEIVEPLYIRYWFQSALMAVILKLAAKVRGVKQLTVAYAIENLEARAALDPARIGFLSSEWAYRRILWSVRSSARVIDRMAFGSEQASRNYAAVQIGDRAAQNVILRLGAPCDCGACNTTLRDPSAVLFVGEFSQRKGVDALMAAWPIVELLDPLAHIAFVGFGPLLDDVGRFCGAPRRKVVMNATRPEVHAEFACAAVVVLLSGRTDSWREQIGLPIVEGLSHGCRVVASAESALAEWLEEHGHAVCDPSDSRSVADGIVGQIGLAASADTVATLPAVDGRRAAELWLYEDSLR